MSEVMEAKEWIRTERKRRGWTQAHLAEIICVHRVTISTYENGRCQPTETILLLLSYVFGDKDL